MKCEAGTRSGTARLRLAGQPRAAVPTQDFLNWKDGFFGGVWPVRGALLTQLVEELFCRKRGLVVEEIQQRVLNIARR